MKKNLLFSVLLAGISNICYSQAAISKDSLPKHPEKENSVESSPASRPTIQTGTRESRAEQQIIDLKNGVLLVRLRTQENAIKNLQKTNKAKARLLKTEQDSANFQLARAFRKEFDFCSVYFFYSTNSEAVKNGQTAGFFLNEQLRPDSTIILPEKPFLIAEITEIQEYEPEPEHPRASSHTGVMFRALVLRDKNLNQLASPFPFYVKIQELLPPRKRTARELVSMLDLNLKNFYKTVNSKVK